MEAVHGKTETYYEMGKTEEATKLNSEAFKIAETVKRRGTLFKCTFLQAEIKVDTDKESAVGRLKALLRRN